ncbi:hypothetical protein BU25DRAFT_191866 [Macroventuria anomochaeta]|uniref:Uncharacterized protein n=1 Tax=Macroventuria anomochaeta TaxID=301207 RepID=A0ACB6SDB2_9PLEO|nr:uncharacterized protein BU25DRAFT_191866 [Macroventuria anomochaeta]KAF2631600.1 hypothetical protein BU25DRAFT_191866 [Macroventuria anomochaeta]
MDRQFLRRVVSLRNSLSIRRRGHESPVDLEGLIQIRHWQSTHRSAGVRNSCMCSCACRCPFQGLCFPSMRPLSPILMITSRLCDQQSFAEVLGEESDIARATDGGYTLVALFTRFENTPCHFPSTLPATTFKKWFIADS